MRTVILEAGPVAIFESGAPQDPFSAVVGAGLQWADDSDATYSQIVNPDRTDARVPTAGDAGIDPAKIMGGRIRYRALVDGGVILSYLTDVPVDGDAAYAEPGLAEADGVEDFAVAFTVPPSQIAKILSSTTPYLEFQAPSLFTLTVFKAWVEIDVDDDGMTLPLRRNPPLRQYPRSDGLGTSTAPRIYPPAPSIQASNRRAGGYL